MKKFLLLLILATPVHAGQFRTTAVANDPDRSWAYCWSINGGMDGPYTLNGQPAEVFRRPRTGEGWKEHFHIGVKLPSKPGVYKFSTAGADCTFTVEAAPKARPSWSAQNGTSAKLINQKLAEGFNIVLTGNYYEWTESIVLPPVPCSIKGYGATIRRLNNGNISDYRQRVFYGGKDFTLEGVTLYAEDIIFHTGIWSGAPGEVAGGETGKRFVIKNCTFLKGDFGYNLQEILVQDCTFDGAGITQAPRGMYLRNQFKNAACPHSFNMTAGCSGDVAFIDNVFTNTGQGPTFSSVGAAYTDGFFYGTRCIALAGSINNCESFMCEGGSEAKEFSRNIIFNTHISGVGNFFQMDCPCFDNLIEDAMIRSPGAIILYGTFPQERNNFYDFELEGPIYMGKLATNNTFSNFGIRWSGPSRANQGAYIPYDITPAIKAEIAGNKLVNPSLYLAPGLIPFVGVTYTGAKVNGVIKDD